MLTIAGAGDPEAVARWADVLTGAGPEYTLAVAIVWATWKLGPDIAGIRSRLDGDLARIHEQLARIYRRLGRIEKGVDQ